MYDLLYICIFWNKKAFIFSSLGILKVLTGGLWGLKGRGEKDERKRISVFVFHLK